MSEPQSDIREPEPDPVPHPLDYARPNDPKPPKQRTEIAAPLSAGCGYAVLAMTLSFAVISSARTNSNTVFLVPAILLGGPFLLSLCVRGWRAFALGILIMTGLVVLIVGTCSVLVFRGL